jgi:nucleotidyltransferase substrate binding protein (TIGR01987 family)
MPHSAHTLKKALNTLTIALEIEKNAIVRDSAIQRFEYCFELSWKAIKKQLNFELGEIEVDGISRRELFRKAQEQKLISSQELWFDFHLARNSTSHNYNEVNADNVYEVTKKFSIEMNHLIHKLVERGWEND